MSYTQDKMLTQYGQQQQSGNLGGVSSNIGLQNKPNVSPQSSDPTQVGCKFGLDLNDSILILIDHQIGLFGMVKDMDVADLKNNVLALAKAATLSKIPVILTAVDEDGPNGRLLAEFESAVPKATFVPRTGDLNAWDCKEFVSTIESFGKKTLIMAGTLTNVCLAFPAISAACCGYNVYAVIDSSGASSKLARQLVMHRFIASKVTPIDTLAMISELMKTHDREDKAEWWKVICAVLPNYQYLVESFNSLSHPSSHYQDRDTYKKQGLYQGQSTDDEYKRFRDPRSQRDEDFVSRDQKYFTKDQDIGRTQPRFKESDVGGRSIATWR